MSFASWNLPQENITCKTPEILPPCQVWVSVSNSEFSYYHGRGYRGSGQYKRVGGRVYSVLTSLSFHSPGMQKDSSRSLPHRSKMRNSTNNKQAGGKRHVLSKQHVYNMFTGYKQTNTAGRRRTTRHTTHEPRRQLTNLLVSYGRPQVGVFIWQETQRQFLVNMWRRECVTSVSLHSTGQWSAHWRVVCELFASTTCDMRFINTPWLVLTPANHSSCCCSVQWTSFIFTWWTKCDK